jgi:hypothetical protein
MGGNGESIAALFLKTWERLVFVVIAMCLLWV